MTRLRRLWQRVEHGLIRGILCNMMFLGMLSLRYDFQAHRLRPSRTLKVYSLVQNLTVLVLMPVSLVFSFANLAKDTNILSRYSHAANIACRTAGLLLTLVQRWQCEPLLVKLVENLRSLHCILEADCTQGGTTSGTRSSKLRFLLYINVAIMWYHCVIILVRAVEFFHTGVSLLQIGVSYYRLVMINHIHVVVVQHAVLLCYFYERFVELNAQLEQLDRVSSPRKAVAALQRMCRTHAQLLRYMHHFKDMFQMPVLCALATIFVNHTTTGYYFVKVIVGKHDVFQLGAFSYAINGLVYVLIFIAFYNYLVVCECAANEVQRTRAVLIRSLSLPHLVPSMERACEIFLLQQWRVGVDIRICGMFAMNHRAVFLVTQQILFFTITLVQYDYHNI